MQSWSGHVLCRSVAGLQHNMRRPRRPHVVPDPGQIGLHDFACRRKTLFSILRVSWWYTGQRNYHNSHQHHSDDGGDDGGGRIGGGRARPSNLQRKGGPSIDLRGVSTNYLQVGLVFSDCTGNAGRLPGSVRQLSGGDQDGDGGHIYDGNRGGDGGFHREFVHRRRGVRHFA